MLLWMLHHIVKFLNTSQVNTLEKEYYYFNLQLVASMWSQITYIYFGGCVPRGLQDLNSLTMDWIWSM